MNKGIFYFAMGGFALATVFASCNQKKGCTDQKACNYDEKAVVDNGTCDFCDTTATLKAAIKENYANMAFANYQDAYNEAVKLRTAINAFVDAPSEATLQTAKEAWLAAREPYGQSEAFRFANGPIDADDGPEGLLNAWPLDEGYIDYTQGGTDYSIVNDPVNYPDITKEVLEGLNEKNGEKNISVGYHAIEFLLWGQDDPDAGKRTAGERPFTDYITDGTASHQARRGTFLKLCADLLLDHLQLMLDAWNPKASDNYRATFLAMDNDEALRNIFTAMGTFSKSELAGERIFVALKNQDQEDEHSCFSDNTHRDIITNAQGIRNVFTGTYTQLDGNTVSGASVQDLIELVHGNMATEMNALSTQSIDAVNHIPVPFDLGLTNETIGGDGPIMKAVIALQSQGDKFAEVAKALGLTISTKLPE